MISVAIVGMVSTTAHIERQGKIPGWAIVHFNILSSSTYTFDRTGKPILEEFNFRVHLPCRDDDPILKQLVEGTMVSLSGFLRKHKKQPYILANKPVMIIREEAKTLTEILPLIPEDQLDERREVEELE